jgi:hypothetical protein
MKVTAPWKRLLAAIAAGGLYVSGTVYAANLNENLLINGGFESINDTLRGAYNSPQINNWVASAAGKEGYAYSHDGSLSAGFVVPDYANGAPLANGGHWYFSPNAGPASAVINGIGQLYQDVDVSTGDTLTLINTGNAAFNVSAYFSSYAAQNDVGHVHLDFRNAANASIGTAELVGVLPLNEWKTNSRGGLIPAATRSVRVSIFGTTPVGGGPDGYMDNVDFRVTTEVLQPTLSISVNRDTGTISLVNQTGTAVPIKSYAITSAFEALEPANWRSITDNYDAGNAGPNQIDAIHNWSKLTDPAVNGDLSEADLETGVGGSIGHAKSISVGNAGAWIQNPTEDLVFQYISGTEIKTGIVQYTGHGNAAFARGDFNVDGFINSSDWVILRNNQLTSLTTKSLAEAYRLGDLNADKLNDHADFIAFKTAYDAANGAGAFVAMLATVPEPSTALLVLAAGTFALCRIRKHA